jgi:hypothetical protein
MEQLPSRCDLGQVSQFAASTAQNLQWCLEAVTAIFAGACWPGLKSRRHT